MDYMYFIKIIIEELLHVGIGELISIPAILAKNKKYKDLNKGYKAQLCKELKKYILSHEDIKIEFVIKDHQSFFKVSEL